MVQKKFASLHVEISRAGNIGQTGDTPSEILLWISKRLHKIPGLEPLGYNSL